MIIRLTTKLGKKIHVEPTVVLPADPNPFADWSARVFTVERAQYILVTNTVSLFSVIMHAKGIADDNAFLKNFVSMLREVAKKLGVAPLYDRFVAPGTSVVHYSKALGRSITASMNGLEQDAAFTLGARGLSPFDASIWINQRPMGALSFSTPAESIEGLQYLMAERDSESGRFVTQIQDPVPAPPVALDADAQKLVAAQRVSRSATTSFGSPLSFTKVYQFKITLCGTEPVVWRRIQVPGCYSFWDLHCAITDAFGWLDYHLHLFTLKNPATGELVRLGIPDDDGEDEEFLGYKTLPGWKSRISRFFLPVNSRAEYEYDFGDGWRHEVELEAILPKEAGVLYPRCIDGANACPPEDCGGIGGYENFKRSLRDPRAKDRADLLRWVGGWFDPEWFDRGLVQFGDPRVRWDVAFREAPIPEGLRIEQYHRLGKAHSKKL